jgi:GcrA cell cycle regulator
MQPDWVTEHCEALREYSSKGMSYSEIARAINARFGTAYSRSATIGHARRMGFGDPGRYKDTPEAPPSPGLPPLRDLRQRHLSTFVWPMPVFETITNVQLRCVEIEPRHLSLMELERGDCRYPYGGDEADQTITFCGHPRRKGSSYCTPHFNLTRGPGTASERAAVIVKHRVVEAA